MNITSETLAVFLFLMPGFLSSLILNVVLVRRHKEHLPLIVEALSFSFLIYVFSSFVTDQSPFSFVAAQDTESPTSYRIVFNWTGILLVFAPAVVFPLVCGLFVTKDWHMKFLRWCHITDKTARGSVWQDVLTDERRYVIVNLADGRRVFGWPMYFSDMPEEGQIYLYDAAWIEEDGKYRSLDIHGLFLVKSENIESIEFTNVDAARAEEDEQ